MTRAWLLLLVIAACQADQADYPVIGGGGGGGGGSNLRPDGGIPGPGDDGGIGSTLKARVCLILEDLRNLTSCESARARGITVTIGTRTVVTADDGSFEIPTPVGTNLVWRASGGVAPNVIVPTVMPFSPSLLIPVVEADRYIELLRGNGVLNQDDIGSIVATVERAGARVRGAEAITDPVQAPVVLYDDDLNRDDWDPNETGGKGIVWLPGVPIGNATGTATVTVTVRPPIELGSQDVIADIPVEEGAITFAALEFP